MRLLLIQALLLMIVCLSIDTAKGQTCASPAIWQPMPSAIDFSGTTCGHEKGLISICQGGFGMPGEAYVARIFVDDFGTYSSITFQGGAGYTISAFLVPVSDGCMNDAPCTTTADGTTPMSHADIPPGEFYVIITGADFDPPGACGPFTVLRDGSFPVTLQHFSID